MIMACTQSSAHQVPGSVPGALPVHAPPTLTETLNSAAGTISMSTVHCIDEDTRRKEWVSNLSKVTQPITGGAGI